ncbi:MAG: LuxR family transcriptional regulator, partial [Verrucomicrobiaceae bacterium]
PPLPPRQRQTLNLLIHGHSRNEIAHRLRISVHTVGDYIKAIYSHFGVQSRAELMSRFPGELPPHIT